jgi:hypothetical protein
MPEGSQATKAAVKIVDAKRLDQSQKQEYSSCVHPPPPLVPQKTRKTCWKSSFFKSSVG